MRLCTIYVQRGWSLRIRDRRGSPSSADWKCLCQHHDRSAHILICGPDSDQLKMRGWRFRSQAPGCLDTLADRIGSRSGVGRSVDRLPHVVSKRAAGGSTHFCKPSNGRVLCLTPSFGGEEVGGPTLDSFAGPKQMLAVVNDLLNA